MTWKVRVTYWTITPSVGGVTFHFLTYSKEPAGDWLSVVTVVLRVTVVDVEVGGLPVLEGTGEEVDGVGEVGRVGVEGCVDDGRIVGVDVGTGVCVDDGTLVGVGDEGTVEGVDGVDGGRMLGVVDGVDEGDCVDDGRIVGVGDGVDGGIMVGEVDVVGGGGVVDCAGCCVGGESG